MRIDLRIQRLHFRLALDLLFLHNTVKKLADAIQQGIIGCGQFTEFIAALNV